jgi:hypothetical protein
VLVGQHFAGIGKSYLLGDRYNRCRTVAEMQDRLVDPGNLAAIHTAGCSSYCKDCAVVGPKCSTKKTGRVLKRKLQIAVASGTEMAGLDNLRMRFEKRGPVG